MFRSALRPVLDAHEDRHALGADDVPILLALHADRVADSKLVDVGAVAVVPPHVRDRAGEDRIAVAVQADRQAFPGFSDLANLAFEPDRVPLRLRQVTIVRERGRGQGGNAGREYNR